MQEWEYYIKVVLNEKVNDVTKSNELGVYLHTDTSEETVLVDGELSAATAEYAAPLAKGTFSLKFGTKQNDADVDVSLAWGYKSLLRKSGIPKDCQSLFIKAKICIIGQVTTGEGEAPEPLPLSAATPALGKDLADGTILEEFSDFTVISRQNDKIPFYRNVMAARVPVFKAMLLQKESVEVKNSEVKIID